MPRQPKPVELSTGPVYLDAGKWYGLSISGGRHIIVPHHASAQNELDTWAHETLHLSRPDLTEGEVCRIAGDLAAVLWRVGYRKRLSSST